MEIPFKVICINDADKPSDIPNSKWIKKGNLYTVNKVVKMIIQGGKLGFYLDEVNLDGCAPYSAYSANRFGVILNSKVLAEIELNALLKEAIEEEKYEEFNREEVKKTRSEKKMAK
jgi:hypothetical protein